MPTKLSLRLLCLSLLTSLLILPGCGTSKPVDSESALPKKLRVVTTCAMVTDIVRQVVGERAEVIGLLGEGSDPHLYTPGRNDVEQLASADVVFYSGLMLEGGMDRVLKHEAGKKKPVFAVTDVLEKTFLRSPPEFEGHPDPHVWMDVKAWSQCVGFVAEKMAVIDAPGAVLYRKNAAAYQQQLSELDGYIRTTIATVPESQRYLVTAHDAFEYFARAYDIQVKSVQGISTQSEAAVSDVNELVDFMVKQKVPAIFVESSVSPKNIEAVKEGCASRGWQVTVGASLFSDAMGGPGTYEGTFIGMLDHNATKIARTLGGTAPELGWQGKLAAEK